MPRNGIEIELDTPNGPIVEYGPDDTIGAVDAQMPPGWRVDWDTDAYKLRSGRFRSPLVRLAHRPVRAGALSNHKITVRATDDERKAWQAVADEAGVSLTQWIRDRCNLSVARRSK